MSRSRAQRRAVSGVTVQLFADNATLGYIPIKVVSAEFALTQVALRKWREIFLSTGELAGVQPIKPEEPKTLHQVLTERLVGVTITLVELQRNAGLFGRSHTIGMEEWKRLSRHVWAKMQPARAGEQPAWVDTGKAADPEDKTEKAIKEVRMWPYPASRARHANGEPASDEDGRPMFADKAVRIYPKTWATRHC